MTRPAETVVPRSILEPLPLAAEAFPLPTRGPVADALIALAEANGDVWEPLREQPPRVFEAGLEEVVQPGLEVQIEREWIASVENACAQPRIYLRHTEEVDRIDRVRRMAGTAAAHLGAHPENWERMRIGSVVPRKLLSRRLDEELDIYENRVLVNAVAETLEWARRRIQDVNAAKRSIEGAARAIRHALSAGNHWTKTRISTLVGRDLEWGRLETMASEALARLERLESRLARLFRAPVFGLSRARVEPVKRLHETNILANDVRYRRAVLMLKAVRRAHVMTDEEPPRVRRHRYQQAASRFCAAVVRRALESLGLSALPDGITWAGPIGMITVESREEGVSLLHATGAVLDVTFFPADAAGSWVAVSEKLIRARLGDLRVVLLPSFANDPTASVLRETPGGAVAAVGPYDLTSVERVAHLVWTWFAVQAAGKDDSWFCHCPLCPKDDFKREHWPNGGSRFLCAACGARWEIRICDRDRCRRAFPVLAVPRDEWADHLDSSRDWWARPQSGRYLCSHCGA